MTENLKKLIEAAEKTRMTEKQEEQQRRSFVYGNTHIENDRVTREMVDDAADTIANE